MFTEWLKKYLINKRKLALANIYGFCVTNCWTMNNQLPRNWIISNGEIIDLSRS